MLRWLFQSDQVAKSFDSPSETQSARDDRKSIGDFADNILLFDLVIGEIELAVVRFELEKEQKEEEERKAERRPDYSWLVTGGARRHRKQLSLQEKNRIENACERLKPCEWSKTIDTWKTRTQSPTSRDQIIEEFVLATHGTIQARKHEPTISEVLKNFATGKAGNLHTVRHGELPRQDSNRSLAELSFIELQEMV
ncbi:Protein CBG17667 [Caenorhabditis briggsae]|uniref:Uncharacterized protein n=2 Tax=Caenorhabditis briggsae TaxID=6238 RepID=A0AAE9JHV4_CAEBR|nr:Protein CBG17667 [Caenorhabditis briggsae]ULT96839.1 hypothetical protein L3Y34_004987 [Caenorhabditis briggsae]UMM30010.1 hypothetical protein L5515_012080 [Caenorhabditis briggsae]CAP35278.1 Protein CBG17667 [Caenorhabditis briggsae]